MKKKKTTEEIKSPKQIHEELNACINCVFEDTCATVLPFPVNLYDCCNNYEKTEYHEPNIQ